MQKHFAQKTIRASLVALVAGLLQATALAQSCNTADRSVLLILDASGSMNAKLPNGETRIAVAQRAIKGVAGFIPAQAQLSLRMYGAQSTAREKNCQDTNLAVPFGPASAMRLARMVFCTECFCIECPLQAGRWPMAGSRLSYPMTKTGHSR